MTVPVVAAIGRWVSKTLVPPRIFDEVPGQRFRGR
jgi:hypothetical protein